MSSLLCPVPGCKTRIPSSRLMCLAHWRQVPADLRHEVKFTADPAIPYEAHVVACLDAIQAVSPNAATS